MRPARQHSGAVRLLCLGRVGLGWVLGMVGTRWGEPFGGLVFLLAGWCVVSGFVGDLGVELVRVVGEVRLGLALLYEGLD